MREEAGIEPAAQSKAAREQLEPEKQLQVVEPAFSFDLDVLVEGVLVKGPSGELVFVESSPTSTAS